MDKLEKWVRIRIRLVGFCFLVAFSFIVVRAFHRELGELVGQGVE